MALLREGTVIKVMPPRFLFPRAIVWTKMAFLMMFWQQPMTRACARAIQILSELWTTVQMGPEFLWLLHPLPCIEMLLSLAELIKRSDSEQHSVPDTQVFRTPWAQS